MPRKGQNIFCPFDWTLRWYTFILFSPILDIKISPLEKVSVFQAKHFNSGDTYLYTYTLCMHYA